jgi:excisionase family DNA binding protein
MPELPEVLTICEAARYLRVHEATLRRWMRDGLVPYSKMPKRVLFRKAALDAMLRQQEQRHEAPASKPRLVRQPGEADAARPRPPAASAGQPYDRRKAELITRLRAMKAQGLSYQPMANQLNAEGVPTLSGRGKWTKGTIGNLLADKASAEEASP